MAKSLDLRGVGKTYSNGVVALANLDLSVTPGERLAIVGPSGSGKSTLLRVVAGLERPELGTIEIGGADATRLAPSDRDVAMVFQQPAVYPYLNVFDNLAFGLRARRVARRQRKDRVESIAERLGLTALLRRRPDQLSGGQRQRVAIGRAIARRPSVLLLDEPFSALDAPLRAALRAELADLQRDEGTTTLHVTHDQAEALAFGDRVAVLLDGRLVQIDDPRTLYAEPINAEVATFIGSPPMNLLPVVLEARGGEIVGRGPGFRFERRWDQRWADRLGAVSSGAAVLGLRPEQVVLVNAGSSMDQGDESLDVSTRLVRVESHGHETIAILSLEGQRLQTRLGPTVRLPPPGAEVVVRLLLKEACWFDAATGARIVSASTLGEPSARDPR